MKKRCACYEHRELKSLSHITQIRIYYRGPENILQEYAYSESKDRNSWYYGNLHKLNIALDPTSNVVAVRHQDYGVRVFFQGQCPFAATANVLLNDHFMIRPTRQDWNVKPNRQDNVRRQT